METQKSATLLRLFVGERERYGHQPLYEAIVLKAREHGLAGATVLRGRRLRPLQQVAHGQDSALVRRPPAGGRDRGLRRTHQGVPARTRRHDVQEGSSLWRRYGSYSTACPAMGSEARQELPRNTFAGGTTNGLSIAGRGATC